MIISVNIVLLLILFHFIGDYILQSDRVATNKNKLVYLLCIHTILYLLPFVFLWFPKPPNFEFLIFNFVAHFIIDYISSRINSKLWSINKRHWFFVCMGADQALHIVCLILSYAYFVEG